MGCGCGGRKSSSVPATQTKFAGPSASASVPARQAQPSPNVTCWKCKVGILQRVQPLKGPPYLRCSRCRAIFAGR